MSGASGTRPVSELLSDALDKVSRLVQGEVALARAEVEQSVQRAASGFGMMIGGAVIGIVALNVLAGAAAAALAARGMSAAQAALIVGIVLAALAILLAVWGRSAMATARFIPSRAIRNVRRDAQSFKEALHNDPAH